MTNFSDLPTEIQFLIMQKKFQIEHQIYITKKIQKRFRLHNQRNITIRQIEEIINEPDIDLSEINDVIFEYLPKVDAYYRNRDGMIGEILSNFEYDHCEFEIASTAYFEEVEKIVDFLNKWTY